MDNYKNKITIINGVVAIMSGVFLIITATLSYTKSTLEIPTVVMQTIITENPEFVSIKYTIINNYIFSDRIWFVYLPAFIMALFEILANNYALNGIFIWDINKLKISRNVIYAVILVYNHTFIIERMGTYYLYELILHTFLVCGSLFLMIVVANFLHVRNDTKTSKPREGGWNNITALWCSFLLLLVSWIIIYFHYENTFNIQGYVIAASVCVFFLEVVIFLLVYSIYRGWKPFNDDVWSEASFLIVILVLICLTGLILVVGDIVYSHKV